VNGQQCTCRNANIAKYCQKVAAGHRQNHAGAAPKLLKKTSTKIGSQPTKVAANARRKRWLCKTSYENRLDQKWLLLRLFFSSTANFTPSIKPFIEFRTESDSDLIQFTETRVFVKKGAAIRAPFSLCKSRQSGKQAIQEASKKRMMPNPTDRRHSATSPSC
jgi:hypothetical protein